jgi:CubicO group peptidase (beta-lactamase class C family)
MRRSDTAVAAVCVLLVTALVGPVAATGADAPPNPDVSSAGDGAAAVQSTENAVDGTVFDELLAETMEDHNVAGASVAVVEGDEIVHAEGYGYANVETGEAVDPNETSFMIGSVAKLLVWTAVMQGVEEGVLDLDEPVGTYLEEHEFDGDDEVTLEDLGTHAAGYEDRLAGIFVEDAEAAADWEAKLEREMPAQVREPGDTVAYSNHGTALAGLVVQEAFDEPFGDHVETALFAPLSMDGATFEQPVPPDREPVSMGHAATADGFDIDDPAIVGVPPAGSMSATATDMGNFAIAKLQNGEFDDEQVVDVGSVDTMFDQRATNHPGVNGVGYGYMLGERGGEELVWHTGGTEYFNTLFALFPDHDVGFFVSFNTAEAGPALADVLDGFIDERFDDGTDDSTADDDAALEPDPETADRADEYEGTYRTTGFQTTHEKLVGLADAHRVSVTEEGYLELENPLLGDGTRWVEVEPGVFVQTPGEEPLLTSTIAIENGTLFMDAPTAPYESISWYETTVVQLGLAGAVLATVLSPLIVWPVSAYRHRGRGQMRGHLTRTRLAILASTLLCLGFVVGLAVNVVVNAEQFLAGYTPWLRLAFGLLVVLPVTAAVALVLLGLEWRRVVAARSFEAGSTNRYGLAYLTVLVLALLVLVWQLWYWNLLTAATF